MQDLLFCVDRLQNDLQQEKNEYHDQKKLVDVYREDFKKLESELREKSHKEVCLAIGSLH